VVRTKLLAYSVGAASSGRRAADAPVVATSELDHQRTAGEPAGIPPLLLNCAPQYLEMPGVTGLLMTAALRAY
jgi:hypothetical protein